MKLLSATFEMIDSFQEIKLKSKTIETLKDAEDENDFEQQSLNLQEQIITIKQMETILDEQKSNIDYRKTLNS